MFLMFQFLVFTLLLLLNTFIRYWYFWFDFCLLLRNHFGKWFLTTLSFYCEVKISRCWMLLFVVFTPRF